MKILLRDYKEGVPVEVKQTYEAKSLDLEFIDLHYLKPLEMTGVVEKGIDTVAFRGSLTSQVEHLCGRCLKKVTAGLEESFELYYETADKEEIDTLDDLREAVLLDHPISFVCSETCKGLCPHCGSNRNEKKCGCESVLKNNVFADLKKILQNKKKPKL
mgnify:FL=1